MCWWMHCTKRRTSLHYKLSSLSFSTQLIDKLTDICNERELV